MHQENTNYKFILFRRQTYINIYDIFKTNKYIVIRIIVEFINSTSSLRFFKLDFAQIVLPNTMIHHNNDDVIIIA